MRIFMLSLSCALALALAPTISSAQNDSVSDVETAARDLDKWLGTDANGNTWRSYLLLKILIAEVSADRESDPTVLLEVWRRFTSGEAGLEGKRFQNVRVALEKHLNDRLRLARSQVATLAKEAADQYAAPTDATIAKAETELRVAAAAVRAQVLRLPSAQQSAARKHFGDATLAAIASGKKVDDEQLDQLAAATGKFKWRVYEKRYIDQVKKLQQAKKMEAVDVTDLSVWNEAKVNGLEGPAYTRLRNAVSMVQNLRAAAAAEGGKEVHQTTIESLAEQLKQADDDLDANGMPTGLVKGSAKTLALPSAVEAAQALGRLQRSGQAGSLAAEAIRGFSLPNVAVYASSDFFAGGLEQKIDRVRPVNDNILGTSVHGTAHVVGQTDVRMLTNPHRAGYRILLDAVANSNSVGYNGPVTIYTTGVTNLHGEKRLHFDDEIGGMKPSPATASANTCTTINDICARSRLVTRIAWKRAMASKGEAEAIASSHAADNLRTEMDQQAYESTNKLNRNFEDKYRRPLLIRGEYPRQFLTSSSNQQMQVIIAQRALGQLAAPTTPPEAPSGDIVAQVHESYILNYARAMLGGQQFTALEIRQMQESMGGEVPSLAEIVEERDYESEEDAVARLAGSLITFDDEVPLRVEFRGDHVLLVMRVKQVDRVQDYGGPQDIETVFKNVEISALYQLVQSGDDYVLQRDKMNEDVKEGEVGAPEEDPDVKRGVYSVFITPPAGNAGAVRRADTARRNFTNRFRKDVFPIEIKLGPLDFSKRKNTGTQTFGNWSKLPAMPTTHATSAAGWLTLAWTLPETPAKTEFKPVQKKKVEAK
jgi:hypothetical protein